MRTEAIDTGGVELVLPPKPEALPTLGQGILTDIAAGLACSLEPDGMDFDLGSQRRYARLLHTPAYEAWLIAWPPAPDLALHDHGGSQGVFHVASGTLFEAHADLVDPTPLRMLSFGAGEGRYVAPTLVHRVWNPGPADAVSVHVYSPPLTSMTFYDHRAGTFLAPLRTELVEGTPEAGVGP